MFNTSNSLVIKQYALLQSASFLFKLSTPLKISEAVLQLMDIDYEWYRKLHSFRQNIASAVKVIQAGNPLMRLRQIMIKMTSKPPAIHF